MRTTENHKSREDQQRELEAWNGQHPKPYTHEEWHVYNGVAECGHDDCNIVDSKFEGLITREVEE